MVVFLLKGGEGVRRAMLSIAPFNVGAALLVIAALAIVLLAVEQILERKKIQPEVEVEVKQTGQQVM